MGLIMNATKDFMLEASGRAEALQRLPCRVAAVLQGPCESSAAELATPPDTDYLVSAERKLEVADLCHFFYGGRARGLFACVLSPYLFGGMVAHGVVFANSFAANVPVFFSNGGKTCTVAVTGNAHDGAACLGPFLLYLVVFALLGLPLACCELKEQRNVQMTMFGARVVVVLLLSCSVLAGFACDGTVFVPEERDASSPVATAPLFGLAGLPRILPVSVYAFIFHHSTPVISQVVADKRLIPRAFGMALAITGCFYALLGVTVAAWFGGDVNAQCNLNWKSYVGCVPPKADGRAATMDDQGWGARLLAFVILVFPALDVLSAFPLSAITLGNNLRSAINPRLLQSELSAGVVKPPPGAARRAARLLLLLVPESRRARTRAAAFRLLAAAPPLFVSALATWLGLNLGQIFRVVGALGIVIALVVPALLRIQSYARHEAVLRAVQEAVTEAQAGGTLGAAEAEEAGAAIVAAAMAAPLPLLVALRAPRVATLEATPYTGFAIRVLGRRAAHGVLGLAAALTLFLLLTAVLGV
jgi:hypothetical protein